MRAENLPAKIESIQRAIACVDAAQAKDDLTDEVLREVRANLARSLEKYKARVRMIEGISDAS